MSVDVSGLREHVGRQSHGYRTRYYYDKEDKLVAKSCPRCNTVQDYGSFHKSPATRSGLSSSCKLCTNSSNRKSRLAETPEEESHRKAKTADTLRRRAARTRAELSRDRDRLRPDGVKTCRVCRLDILVDSYYQDKYSPDSLDSMCVPCRKTRAREKKREPIVEYWMTRGIPIECYVCGGPYDHSDHVVPLHLGGHDAYRNMLPMCEKHNTSKGAKPLGMWLISKKDEFMVMDIIYRVSSYDVCYIPYIF